MLRGSSTVTNVIRFPTKQALSNPNRIPRSLDRKAFLDVVHACGTLLVAGDDRISRSHAIRLSVLGLVAIDEIANDGTLRRLRSSEAFLSETSRPWRVSKFSKHSSVSLAPITDEFRGLECDGRIASSAGSAFGFGEPPPAA